ncbi:class I SAM-dependent methyltransferase [Myxococcota bacterium]|nr:class I SAM-dependent methyltransferase [Myxococcota bacterium]
MHPCPLCASESTRFYWQDRTRTYFECPTCDLVFVDPAQLPEPAPEKARYETHNNAPDEPGYLAFLGRFAAPMALRLGDTPQEGLDFGSGPGPALHLLLERHGHSITLYDPFFAPDEAALARTYDFITCTEAIEHFHDPGREWPRLMSLLRPGGLLGIMTRLRPDFAAFQTWRYREDFTHVGFFSRETFLFLADRWDLTVEFVDWDLIFLRK